MTTTCYVGRRRWWSNVSVQRGAILSQRERYCRAVRCTWRRRWRQHADDVMLCCTLYVTTALKTARRWRSVVLYVVRDDGAEDSTQMTLCCVVRCTWRRRWRQQSVTMVDVTIRRHWRDNNVMEEWRCVRNLRRDVAVVATYLNYEVIVWRGGRSKVNKQWRCWRDNVSHTGYDIAREQ